MNLSHKQIAASQLNVLLGSQADRQAASTAMDYSLTATNLVKVLSVRVHCATSPVTTEDLTIKVKNPSESTAHEVTLLQQDMAATTDIHFTDPVFMVAGDVLSIEWTNTDAVSWGVSVIKGGV